MLAMAVASDPIGGSGGASEPVGAAQIQYRGRSVPWYKLGACRGMDTDKFFPDRGERISDEVLEACSSCIVREECETAGLREFGIWGGLSERARLRLRREEEAAGNDVGPSG